MCPTVSGNHAKHVLVLVQEDDETRRLDNLIRRAHSGNAWRPAEERGIELRLRSEEHTSELQSLAYLVCRLLLEKKKYKRFAKYVAKRIGCSFTGRLT